MIDTAGASSLRHEAERLHQRYCVEVIERFGLCPWAKHARLAGRTRTLVVTDPRLAPADIASQLSQWCADTSVDVIFVVAPRFDGPFDPLATWGEQLAQHLGEAFFAAAFHPEPAPSAGVVHLLRQSPDPTVQLIRRAPLESLREQEPPHYLDVFELSLQDLESHRPVKSIATAVVERNERVFSGVDGGAIQRAVAAIRADRESTYARLAQSDRPQRPSLRFK